jgi:hypothetical protein
MDALQPLPTRLTSIRYPLYSMGVTLKGHCGVRPSDWTVSCGGFDSLPSVVILELCRA